MYIFETNFYFNDMLTKFAVTNYRGFKNRIEWDLSHPSNYEWYCVWSERVRKD